MKVSIHRLLEKLKGKKKLKLKVESITKGLVTNVSMVPGLNASNLPPASTIDQSNDFDITYQGKTIKASQAPRFLIEEMAKAQHKQEVAKFQLEVELKKASAKAKLEVIRLTQKQKQIQETRAYSNIMEYPGPGTLLYDRYDNLYKVDSCAKSLVHKNFPDIVIKLVGSKYSEEECNAIDMIWVPTKMAMGLLFKDFKNWPEPTPPVLFCFAGDDDQVWYALHRPADDAAMFKKITDWDELVVDGHINMMVNFKSDAQKDYPVPKILEPDQQDKFDVFLDTLKLRAEIIEEAKQVKN